MEGETKKKNMELYWLQLVIFEWVKLSKLSLIAIHVAKFGLGNNYRDINEHVFDILN